MSLSLPFDFSAGTVIGRYTLTELIGQGGMGVVYKAYDESLDRHIAVKMLPMVSSSDDAYIERFYTEARAAARLVHPNVVTIHEVGRHEDVPYIVMEYIDGKTLKKVLNEQNGLLPPARIIPITAQILAALQLAHKHNIVHRDIKSENVMLAADGLVKVLDFGIARLDDLEESVGASGEITGTAEYISPEQALGEPVSDRSDIYSLGIVLYEMLTGGVPFTGRSFVDIILQHINRDPTPPSDINSDVHPGLASLTVKALMKHPDDRFESAAAMLASLQACGEQTVQPAATAVPAITSHSPKPFKWDAQSFYCELTGRADEWDRLKTAYDRITEHNGRLIALTGEAGSGKTRLAAELQSYASEQGAWTLTGICYHRDAPSPYMPFISALKGFFQYAPPTEQLRIRSLIEEQMPELYHLVPATDLGLTMPDSRLNEEDQTITADMEGAQNKLFFMITRLFKEIAQTRPLLLLIDDVHWADSASLQLLHYLAVEIQSMPVCIAITFRHEEQESEEAPMGFSLDDLLARLSREDLYESISVNRLSSDGIVQMLERTLKRASLAHELHTLIEAETEGNPFFIQEALRWLHDEGIIVERQGRWHITRSLQKINMPTRVYDLLVRRLEGITEDEREVLDAAAVAGEQFKPDLLARVLEINKIKLLRTLHRLEQNHHLISSGDDGYRFDHAKIRDVLYFALSPDLQQGYHALFADCMVDQPDVSPGDLAEHCYLAGDMARAVPALIKAGAEAERYFALPEASHHYERALEAAGTSAPMPQRLDLLLRSGRVLYRLGDWQKALSRFETMQDDVDKGDADKTGVATRAEALLQIGRIRRRQGDWDQALGHYEDSLHIFQQADDKFGAATVYLNYGVVFFERGDWDEATTYFNQGLAIAEEIDHGGLQADIHTSLGAIASSRGDFEEAVRHYNLSRQHYETTDNHYGLAKIHNNLGMTYEDHEDFEQALSHYDSALGYCRKMGSTGLLTLVYLNSAKTAVKVNDADRAEDLCQRALDLLADQGDQPGIAEAYQIYGMLYTIKASWEQAEFYLQESKALFDALENPLGAAEASRELGVMYAERGDAAEAVEALEEARGIFERIQASGDADNIKQQIEAIKARMDAGDSSP